MPDRVSAIRLGNCPCLDFHRVAREEREPEMVFLVRRVQQRQDLEREGT